MIIEHAGKRPRIHPSAYVAPTAVIAGDVEIGAETHVLRRAVIAAEGEPIAIGKYCVVMEHAVIRTDAEPSSRPVSVGDYTLVGPRAYLEGCTLEERCFVATGGTVLERAHVKADTAVAGGMVRADSSAEASVLSLAG